ncbi:MAG TPA: hypothetical protein VFE62_18775 [Gemmataceae bacterium]|nr:hypothetical protein [Gemmataceae bacterium]
MASPSLREVHKVDWPGANPWLWLYAGLVFCVWSWVWVLTFGAESSDYRVIVLAVGMLLMGVGVWLRFTNRDRLYLLELAGPLAVVSRLLMGILFAAITVGVTALFIASFSMGRELVRTPPMVLVWLSAAPLSFFAARRCLRTKGRQEPLELDEEIGLAFVVAGLGVFAGSWALYLGPDDVESWDTIRVGLRVLTAVCLVAAALVVVSTRLRRLVLSFLFLLHFCGICTAALSAPPSPWIIQQTWVRIFRPYLEFMYLNNAYHFYAPEPGPSSYLWFRVIYTDENEMDHGWWWKIPEIDEKGRLGHAVALEYQRYLAMTESIAPSDQLPPWNVVNAGFVDIHPFYKRRMELQFAVNEERVIGRPQTKYPRIPLHPALPQVQQAKIPNDMSRRLLASYARFAARRSYPQAKEGWKFKSVKVYRVIHSIAPVAWYVSKFSPTDPQLYWPYYMGDYDQEGKLLDGDPRFGDPYLYWLLPILRTKTNDPASEIRDYCRLHAGDSHWVRPPGKEKESDWIDPRE